MNRLPAFLFLCLIVAVATAQRRITPINTPATTTQHVNENFNPDSLDRSHLVEMTDAQGRTILVDTIAGTEVVDSAALQVVPKMEYPLVYAASVGVDIWDPVMRLLGQKYGLVEFSAEFNMHNRYIPVVEVGLGMADDRPDDNNYTYKSKMSPYFRLGMNYNFLYNSSPNYMAMAGVRYGYSPFTFELTDVTVDSPYWQETAPMNVPSQSVSVGYLELLFNLRVKIAGPIYLGWAFKFHTILHESKTPYGQPMYIPGYGSRESAVTGAFTVTYTFELNKRRKSRRHAVESGIDEGMYPDNLPELHEGDDPTRVPHFHPTRPDGTRNNPAAEAPAAIATPDYETPATVDNPGTPVSQPTAEE